MAGDEAVKLFSGLWADQGDRIDPDDDSLTVTVVRANGWPDTFSADAGNQPPRRVVNQLFRELQGAAVRAMRFGVEPYDPEIDYPENGRCALGRDIYYAIEANGPTTDNVTSPISPGQSTWGSVTGRVSLPSAPATPTAIPGNGQLDWRWRCPRDGGQRVMSFSLEWRAADGDWSSPVTVISGRYRLTGLQNGTVYQVRVRAHTVAGASPWSSAGSATPAAVRPGKVAGLVATAGEDGQVPLRWSEPDTGGAAISRYEVQWRTESGTFGSTNQANSTSLSTIIGNFSNGVRYLFRVRAVNSAGDGPWSEEQSATPAEPPPPPPVPPPDARPGQPGVGSGSTIGSRILWSWPVPPDGNRRILRYDVQVREASASWPAQSETSVSSCYLQAGASGGTRYEARARAVNTLGEGAWSATVDHVA